MTEFLKPPPFITDESPDPADLEAPAPKPAPDLATGRVNRNSAAVLGEKLAEGQPVSIPSEHHPKLTDAQAKFKIKIRELRLSMERSQTKFGVFFGCPPKNARITVARWESLNSPTLPNTERMRKMRTIKWPEKKDRVKQSDSATVRMEGARPGVRQDLFSLDEGNFTIQWPDPLSPESFEDLKSYIGISLRKIERSVKKSD